MSYSNDLQQIRGGLVNYIGSMLRASKYEGKAAKQVVASVLIEEALKLSQDENNIMDLYVNKPLLRATKILFEQRIVELEKIKGNPAIKEQVTTYNQSIVTLQTLINSIN